MDACERAYRNRHIARTVLAMAAQPRQESPNDLFVTVGKSVIVNSALPIERVSVGFGDVAEATAVGPQEVLVNGKTPGETSLIVWQRGGGKLFFDVIVQPGRSANNSRLDALRRQVNKELAGQNIDLSLENDLVFRRGTVKDLTSAERVVAIASAMGKPRQSPLCRRAEGGANFVESEVCQCGPMSNQLGINIFSTGATNTIGSITTGHFAPPVIGSSTNGDRELLREVLATMALPSLSPTRSTYSSSARTWTSVRRSRLSKQRAYWKYSPSPTCSHRTESRQAFSPAETFPIR